MHSLRDQRFNQCRGPPRRPEQGDNAVQTQLVNESEAEVKNHSPSILQAMRDILTDAAIEVLGQLFVSGPTWDGNISSKSGRDELVAGGLAWHENGYASLTPEGVRMAAGWDMSDLMRRNKRRWIDKLRAS
jgi:hypothetical protein